MPRPHFRRRTMGRTALTAFVLMATVGGLVAQTTTATAATTSTDGSLDKTFGKDGLASIPIAGADGEAFGLAVQPDGKIIEVGQQNSGPNGVEWFIVRFTSGGQPDKTFGTGGTELLKVRAGDADELAIAVAVQPDGKIVVAGRAGTGASVAQDMAVARLLPDGTPDPKFGTDGRFTIDFGAQYGDAASSLALQPDGKIVLVGYAQIAAGNSIALARVTANGALDTTFDGDGKFTTQVVPNGYDYANTVAVQPDGKIVAAGSVGPLDNSDFGFIRLTSLGQLDTSFNGNGKLAVDVGTTADSAHSMLLQPDGKIVAGGRVGVYPNQDMALVRIDSSGLLDPTFDGDGRVVTDFAGSDDQIVSLARQPDGKIVASGESGLATLQQRHLAIARYTTGGALDPTFGSGGKTTFDAQDAGFEQSMGLGFAPDGRIVLGARANGRVIAGRLSSSGFSATGYWLVAADGGVFSYGSAMFHGSTGAIKLNQPIVGTTGSPTGSGYWFVASDGGIFNYGDAGFQGSAGALHLAQPIVGMAATPTGRGYWLVASDGGIFNYGDAGFYGSTGALHLNRPIVAMASTPTGHGYWLVSSDGGIFGFGDAAFYGSTGNLKLNQPIVGMATTPYGDGYWLVASDGGIFSFGAATFLGSTGAIKLNQPIVAMAANRTGNGYWLVASDGGIFNYGDATFLGSTGAMKLNQPIIGAAIR